VRRGAEQSGENRERKARGGGEERQRNFCFVAWHSVRIREASTRGGGAEKPRRPETVRGVARVSVGTVGTGGFGQVHCHD
jgi:hypothetical protein